jgi:hypothetical protein
MILRRILLLSLVAYCASLIGCTTPDVVCGMRINYVSDVRPPAQGNVRLAWSFNAGQRVGSYGNADCTKGDDPLCVLRLKGEPPRFDDVCGMAKFGHELLHGVGAGHD